MRGETRLRRLGMRGFRFLALVIDGFSRHQLTTRAAALTFTTVFALVPTLAVGLAMFKAFGGMEDAKEILLPRIVDYLAVGVRGQVEARIDSMLETIHGGAIGAVGGLFMFGAVVSLLSSIEDTFNHIWGVRQSRNILNRLTVYWTVVTITPVLLIGGLSLPAMLRRIVPIQWVVEHMGPAELILARLLPLILVWLGFTLMYAFMTSARVPVRAALAGGVIGGSLWSAAVMGYAAYAGQSQFYTTVYGPLAAIPVFLFWLYVSWVIVLVGAQATFAAQNLASYRDAKLATEVSNAQREVIALASVATVTRCFIAAETPPTRLELARAVDAPGLTVSQVVDRLIEAGLLYESEETGQLRPSRDPRTTPAADVVAAMRGPANEGGPSDRERVRKLWARAEAASSAAWEGLTCADLAEQQDGS